jgi:AraC family transcriptional regulator
MNERVTRTQEDYAIRLERVVTWLADHLDDAVDLARMADIACMSPFHFHRIYHAMQGETAADTIRRLRLHRAAVDLITGTRSVEVIARRAGYGSQQAFTRAFRAAYGVPPAHYRAASVVPPTSARIDNTMETAGCHATIRQIAPIRVAALAHRGDYQAIGALFQRLSTMAAGQGIFGSSTRVFGIYYDDPSATPRAALRSEACISVPDDWNPSGEVQCHEIRSGRYAVTLFMGPYAELGRRYTWLYGTWLPQSGEEPAHAPCVEEYLNDSRTLPPTELRTEIWLPIR